MRPHSPCGPGHPTAAGPVGPGNGRRVEAGIHGRRGSEPVSARPTGLSSGPWPSAAGARPPPLPPPAPTGSKGSAVFRGPGGPAAADSGFLVAASSAPYGDSPCPSSRLGTSAVPLLPPCVSGPLGTRLILTLAQASSCYLFSRPAASSPYPHQPSAPCF